jgi:alpha-glucosidase
LLGLETHQLESAAPFPFRFQVEATNQVFIKFGTAYLLVTALSSKILRFRYSPTPQFLPRRSWAVAKDDADFSGAVLAASYREDLDVVELTTDHLLLRVHCTNGGIELGTLTGHVFLQDAPGQGPLWSESNYITSRKVLPVDEYYYGFGERTGLLEKRGRRYSCWNTDPGDAHLDQGPGTDLLYQSIPFYMALRPGQGGYGLFFNNTFKTVFDVGHTDSEFLTMEAAGGELDYYVFYGPEPAAIVEAYTSLTGRTPLPPRWALGYHQTRWGYYPEARVREIVTNFRERKLPLEAIHLDIDYMDGYRVFTWDKNHFPDPAKLIDDLNAQGVKVITIIDVGVKYDPAQNYAVYDEGVAQNFFIRKADGEILHGFVWPGDSVFPDFSNAEVRQWWGDLHDKLLELGVQGIWNDMNEPALATAPFGAPDCKLVDVPLDAIHLNPATEELTNHAEIHNIYALLENMGTYQGLRSLQPDVRPFVLTRAGFAGIQRWAAVWTGDNAAVWEHLEMAMPQLSNMGLSGLSFIGTDIGGFHWPSNGELWARWIELGVFYPFSRGHSIAHAPNKEPWVWGEPTESIARKYLELRYQLLPYLYNVFEESTRTGCPVLRPLLYEFYTDPDVLRLHDELMLGSQLLIAPVYRPGIQYRYVYLPGEQGWYDFWSGDFLANNHTLASAPLDVLPFYVKAGTVLPLGPVMQYSDERPLDQLQLEVYLDQLGSAFGSLYEDDGVSFAYQNGESCTTTYSVTTDEQSHLHLSMRRHGNYQPPKRTLEINVHSAAGLKTYQVDEARSDYDLVF